jgi:thiol-disulfide isomerase/thioredoxin
MKKIYTICISMLATVQLSVAQTPLTTAADFTVTTMDGEEIRLFDLLDDGKHVVIDFFAYWCGTCANLAPQFKTAYQNFGCNSGDVFFLKIEGDGTDAQTANFMENVGSEGSSPVVSGLGGGGQAVDIAYGISAYPTFVMIAPDRSIVSQDIWPFSASIVANELSAVGIQPKSCESVNTSIEEAPETMALDVFPNPAQSELNIRFTLSTSERVRFEVYDVMGVLVSSVPSASFSTGTGISRVSLDGFASGTYFLRMFSASQTLGSTRFVVVR